MWAALGYAARAEALAASITDPGRRAEALIQVADALIVGGQHRQVVAAADSAMMAARSITNPELRADSLTRIMRILVAAGQVVEAAAVGDLAVKELYPSPMRVDGREL